MDIDSKQVLGSQDCAAFDLEAYELACEELRLLVESGEHDFYDVDREKKERDVHLYDASGNEVAGLVQLGWYRVATFVRWLRILLDIPEPFLLCRDYHTSQAEYMVDEEEVLESGDYWIVDEGIYSTSLNHFQTS